MREAWTDERLDDLATRMDDGFREGREEARTFRTEMDRRFDQVDAKFDVLNARFDRLQQLMIAALLTIVLGFIVDKV